MKSTGNPAFPCSVFFCGNCDGEYICYRSLRVHRNTFHSSNHTCFLCDSANGKLVKNVNIKDHLTQVHGIKQMTACGCCNYIFDRHEDFRTHRRSLQCTGDLGIERIVAKSNNKPGSLMQENLAEKYEMHVARTEQKKKQLAAWTQLANSSVHPKQPVTTTSVSTCVFETENKENISDPLANKVEFEKPCSDEQGSRLPENSVEKNKVYVARNTNQRNKQLAALAQRSSSSVPANPPVTTTSTCVLETEDKENISNPLANKIEFEEPWLPADTPQFRHAQEFFREYVLPVLIKFHEEKVAEQTNQ